jgi:hypothetical protein
VRRRPVLSALLAAGLLLTAVAWLRGAEYDEQYTLFLTGRAVRPIWPAGVITAAEVRQLQASRAGFIVIARDLRATDVHPPLYFWAIAAWRRLAGDSLFAARMASVLFSVVTLGLVAAIAQSAGIAAVPAVLLTVGCYGFAYTGAIARGFALAQLLSVAGVALLLTEQRRAGRMLAAGILLGAATFANYLAVFVACAALLWLALRAGARRNGVLAGVIGFAVWLPADLWFFLAQRQSRVAQFAPFEPISALARLARYEAAIVFGGLPLYVEGIARIAVTAVLALVLIGLVALTIRRRHQIAERETSLLLAMAAVAPPIGLLLLGLGFDNAPIELRYLAFATPFIGLSLAAALPRRIRHAVLALQAVALFGLITRPETMQPARATAIAAVSLLGDGIVLLPHGNDGVGIVGAFAIEAPPTMRLLVIRSDATPAQIRARAGRYPRAVIAALGQDATSRAALPVMRQAFTDPCWRAAGEGFNVLAFDRICGEECVCSPDTSR